MKMAKTGLLVGLSVSILISISAFAVNPGPVPLPEKKSVDINDPTHACAALVSVCKEAKFVKGKKGDLVKNCVTPIAESKGAHVPKGIDAKTLSGQPESVYTSCQAALKSNH